MFDWPVFTVLAYFSFFIGCGCILLQDIQHLAPATDFYKKLALDCSGQQVAVDLFLLSAQYCDLSSLGQPHTHRAKDEQNYSSCVEITCWLWSRGLHSDSRDPWLNFLIKDGSGLLLLWCTLGGSGSLDRSPLPKSFYLITCRASSEDCCTCCACGPVLTSL